MSANNPPRERLHALDAVRGVALLLGVVLHTTMSFLPGMQLWVTVDSSRSDVLSVLFFVLHGFRMLTFFVLAGLFARLVFHRLGTRGFIWDRFKRIFLPLVVFWFPLLMAVLLILGWNAQIANGGVMPSAPQTPPLSPNNFPLLHLWFLYLLVLFYVIVLVLRTVLTRIPVLARAADAILPSMVQFVGLPLLVAPMIVGLYFQPNWLGWFGIPTPDQNLYPNLAALLAYGSAFMFGWLLHRQTDLLHKLERLWWVYALLAGAGFTFFLSTLGTTPLLRPLEQDKFLYASVYGLAAWSAVFALIGFAMKFWNQPNTLRRYVADASYWIYLMHLPLVMVLQTVFARLEWSWLIKFPLILVIAFAVLFSSYHLLVRHTWLGVFLNGQRRTSPATV